MLKRLDRLSTTLTNETGKSTAATAANLPVGPAGPAAISAVSGLLADGKFRRLLEIHNTIQSVQCFQCPPAPLCCDTKNLVQEVRTCVFYSFCLQTNSLRLHAPFNAFNNSSNNFDQMGPILLACCGRRISAMLVM